MDHDQFEVASFVSKFLGRDHSQVRPGLRLHEAIEMGLISRYSVTPLTACGRIVKEYWEVDETKRAFGDYAGIVLREIWRDIAQGKSPQLAAEIVKILVGRKRIVVFLPPVGDEADQFVVELQRRAEGAFGAGTCFVDFRSRNQEAPPSARFDEFRGHDTKKGPAILVTVDRFGEGVSVPDIDALVMLRATLSPRVAVQALGRGLRLHAGKKDCLVVDGVGFKEIVDQWDGPGVELDRTIQKAGALEAYRVFLKDDRPPGFASIDAYSRQVETFLNELRKWDYTWGQLHSEAQKYVAGMGDSQKTAIHHFIRMAEERAR